MHDLKRHRANSYHAAMTLGRGPKAWRLTRRGEYVLAVLFLLAVLLVSGFCGYIETQGVTP